jgi:RNA polymerase sigma-70 factor (ECF subfamily)
MHDGCPQVDLRRLVHDHHADVYRYARRLAGQDADAEDLVQQTFLLAQRKLSQLREPEKARSWLLAITRNCFLKARLKRIPATATSMDLDVGQVAAGPEELPIDAAALQDAISELPEEFRVVVLMFYFEFLSYRQIAEELDVPVGTVMSRLSRAKRHLRKRLMAAGMSNEVRPPCFDLPVPADSDVSLGDSNH